MPAPGLRDEERGGGRGGEGMAVEEGVLVELRLTAIMILASVKAGSREETWM